MKVFDVTRLGKSQVEEVGYHYEKEGYCVLAGLKERVTNQFYPVLKETLGIGQCELNELLSAEGPAYAFTQDNRRRLAQVRTERELAKPLLTTLQPLISHLLGPLVHVSSTFHAQFKGGSARPVDHGGYKAHLNYMEVHGPYLLHQDFTGAAIPTSPSAMTLWVGLNECPDWPLRLFPGSHKLGLLCNRWLPLDHPGLAGFGDPVNIHAQPGTVVIFNSLLLHGTGEAGPLRRVSCDIRFFPACGFLPSKVHALNDDPWTFIQTGLQEDTDATRRAPLLEDLVLSGHDVEIGDAEPYSVMNWANYLRELCKSDQSRAVSHLERFVNTEIGLDSPLTYVSRFHGHTMCAETLDQIRGLMVAGSRAHAGSV